MSEPKPVVKPGWKSTEFWLTAIAEIVGLIILSGGLVVGSMAAKIVGGIVAVLAVVGYDASRAKVKSNGQ